MTLATLPQTVIHFFKESFEELKKVSWPSQKELIQSTLLVIVISLAVALFLGLLDSLFAWGIRTLL